MAKGITKTQLVRLMAEKLELTNKQTAAALEFLAETAVKETKKSGEFTIPGIGKLVKAERKARIGRRPSDRRSDQDQGQDRGEVPRGQGGERHHRSPQEVVKRARLNARKRIRDSKAGAKASAFFLLWWKALCLR